MASSVIIEQTRPIVQILGTGAPSVSASTFLSLSDTPNSYVGQGLQGVRVNAGETGLEFYTASVALVNGSGTTFNVDRVDLGGTLTSSPNISGAGSFGVTLEALTGFGIEATGTGITLSTGAAPITLATNNLIQVVLDGAVTFQEFADYTANYNDRSYVAKSYVDALVGGISAGHVIENFGSPLTQRANLNFYQGLHARDNSPDTEVTLGGDIFVGDYLPQGAGLFIDDTNWYIGMNDSPSDQGNVYFQPGTGGAPAWRFAIGGDLGVVYTKTSGTILPRYNADYSADYTDRTWVDRGYVLSQTGPTGAWKLASGGTLTGNNIIQGQVTAGSIDYSVKFRWDNLGATLSTGKNAFFVENTTAATNGAQQMTPIFVLRGAGFKTDAGGSSQTVDYGLYGLPIQGASEPSSSFILARSVNGNTWDASPNRILRIDSSPGSGASFTFGDHLGLQGAIRFLTYSAGIVEMQFYPLGGVVRGSFGYTSTNNFTLNTTQSTTSTLTIGTKGIITNQSNLSSTHVPLQAWTPGTHTAIATTSELNAYDFKGASWQWASGTTATQRFNYFRGFTVTGSSPTATFTTVYSVFIEPTTVGSNAAIINNYALGVGGNQLNSSSAAGDLVFAVQATNSGNSTKANIIAQNDAFQYLQLVMASSTYTTSSVYAANTATIVTNGTNGMNIGTANSSALKFWISNNEVGRIDTGGRTQFSATSASTTGALASFDWATAFTATVNNQRAVRFSAGITGSSTASHSFSQHSYNFAHVTGASGQFFNIVESTLASSFAANHTNATFRFINYELTTALSGSQAASATHVFSRHTTGFFQWASVLSPAQITSNQNDYNPNGWTSGGAPYGASIVRLDTDASRDITGWAGGVSGRIVIRSNVGSNPIVLKHDVTSTAANRYTLAGAADLTINAGESWMEYYDGTSSRWRVLGRFSTGGGGSSVGINTEVQLSDGAGGFVAGGITMASSTLTLGLSTDSSTSKLITTDGSGNPPSIDIRPKTATASNGASMTVEGGAASGAFQAGSVFITGGAASGSAIAAGTVIVRGGSASVSGLAGGLTAILGGNAGSGNANGGDVQINGGTPSGSGNRGNVALGEIGTLTFGGGANIIQLARATVNPSSSPGTGTLLYIDSSDDDIAKFRSTSGAIRRVWSAQEIIDLLVSEGFITRGQAGALSNAMN